MDYTLGETLASDVQKKNIWGKKRAEFLEVDSYDLGGVTA